jgi:hypothetical protein
MKDLDALGQTSGFPAPETLIMSLPLELTSLFYIAREYRYHSVFAWLQRQQRANSVGLPAQNPQVTEAQSGIL